MKSLTLVLASRATQKECMQVINELFALGWEFTVDATERKITIPCDGPGCDYHELENWLEDVFHKYPFFYMERLHN